jgi:hypothetical protein
MKSLAIVSSLIAVLLLPFASAAAGDRPVTPYGGYCRECTNYGTCRAQVSPQEAVHSLKKYYEERGYRIGTINHRGRFVEAEVMLDRKQVDKVIFDRKTGRVRSIY